MRFLAAVTLMLAWLAYGMSAFAGCPMCESMRQAASADMTGAAQHHHMAGMDMGDTVKPQTPASDPCPAGGMAHMPFCSACLAVVPEVTVGADGKQMFSYPSPATARALPGARPAPLAPPPRTV
ncbi:hypothetical protein ASE04_14710 [Rhizobium sp. Root708]|nr:hypothetical protein [Rhizobium sp. Root708]KRB49854.1 hypothetical protein ASE04_14710 [Rhizobium sp. Root708]